MPITDQELITAFDEIVEAINELRVSVCQLSVDLNLLWAAYTQKQPVPSKKVRNAVAAKAKNKGGR